MYHYRKLNDTDIHFINELQMQRGYALISEDSLPREWVGYGAFTQEGQIVGICFLFLYRRLPHSDYPNGVIAELGACYTVPEYRRQGIARRMLSELMREGRDEGIGRFTLEVRASNEAAIALYRGLGFYQEGVRKNYYESPREDALILWTRERKRTEYG